MDKIELHQVLPHVFSQVDNLDSEVWNHDISFEKGKTYLIEADSGRGKSSLCGFLMGYRRDYNGSVTFDGEDISSFSIDKWCDLRQHHLSYLFQELRLFPELTAYENVEIKNALSANVSKDKIFSWFQRLGIGEKMDVRVAHLSFGQQQRVALVRALVQPFDFMLLDEPISHLDDKNAKVMADVLMEVAKSQGAAVIVTSIGKHLVLDYDKTFRL